MLTNTYMYLVYSGYGNGGFIIFFKAIVFMYVLYAHLY